MRTRWMSWAAWWSGDLERLMRDTACTAPGGYWDRQSKKPGTKYHLPLAADLARTAAELMYGDTPAIKFESNPDAQTAWEDLSQKIGWANKLLESGEVGAAVGGSYLRPAWDDQTAEHPLFTVVRADRALPEFRFDQLVGVCFVTVLPMPAGWKAYRDGQVWRWLEHHEPRQIRHELWLGSESNLGQPQLLEVHPATEFLTANIPTTAIRPKGILAEYIPCDLPNALDESLPLGRSVLQGVETMLDALDETFDSWMRDFRLGKGRVLLSGEMLTPVAAQRKSSGGGFLGGRFGGSKNTTPAAAFDVDAEAFMTLETPMEQAGANGTTTTPITLVQFAIRVKEHFDTCMAIVEQVVSRAGYAPQTFGINVDGQLSGTAMRRRELRSHRTKDRMRRYARPALERAAETLMLINATLFGGPRPTARPTLEWKDTDGADPKETADTVEILRRAMVMSVETAVREVHPEWDDDQVKDEVGRLAAEQPALTAPSLTGDEPIEPTEDEVTGEGGVTKEQVDMFRSLWLSGVDPAEAARKAGLGQLAMVDNPRPVTVAPDKGDDSDTPAGPPAPGQPPKPIPFPGR
jgi:hypothetical protein